MSVKWNLYADMMNSQEVADERMEKQRADNYRRQFALYAVLFLVFSLICLFSSETIGDWTPGWFLLLIWLAFGLSDVLDWYSGVALIRRPPLVQNAWLARLQLGLGIVITDFILPLVVSWLLLSSFYQPKLSWIGAGVSVAGFYMLRVWSYDQYRRRTLDSGEYLHLSPAEKRDNRLAQVMLLLLTAVTVLPVLALPETSLPGGSSIQRLSEVEQAVSAYQEAEAVAFEYIDGDRRAVRYHLPEEELTVYYALEGGLQEAWLTNGGYYYHYDGISWQQAAEDDQPVRSSVLQVTREQLPRVKYIGYQYEVDVTQEELQAQLLKLDVALFNTYEQVQATYDVQNGQLVNYTYQAYGKKAGIPVVDYYQLRMISTEQAQVASQLAVQKQRLAAGEL